MKVAVVKENAPGERRVALVPETVPRLIRAGLEVLVEQGAGDRAWLPDDPSLTVTLAERGDTAISLDSLPRTLSRAQGMDALTSQANVADYKAALVAAEVESLGATFIELTSPVSAAGEGGYARKLTAAERDAQQTGVVITHGGAVIHPAVAKLLDAQPVSQGS